MRHACALDRPPKSSLAEAYVNNVFTLDYDPTIEDTYTKFNLVDGEPSWLHSSIFVPFFVQSIANRLH